MAWQARHRALLRATVAAGAFVCVSHMALAGEASYCVTCNGPDQTYLCRVAAGGAKASDALKLYCIMRTAKEGHHASCAAERATAACNGVLKVYSYDGPMPEDFAGIKHFADKVKKDQKVFEQPKGNQPKTLVELTGRAFKASRDGIRGTRNRVDGSPEAANLPAPDDVSTSDQPASLNPAAEPLAAEGAPAPLPGEVQPNRVQRAGSAAGDFARKSYRCLISLFRKCSEETAEEEILR
jgi:hypothetical protein